MPAKCPACGNLAYRDNRPTPIHWPRALLAGYMGGLWLPVAFILQSWAAFFVPLAAIVALEFGQVVILKRRPLLQAQPQRNPDEVSSAV